MFQVTFQAVSLDRQSHGQWRERSTPPDGRLQPKPAPLWAGPLSLPRAKARGAGSRAGPGPRGGAAAAEGQAGKRRHIGVGRAVLS